MILEISIVKFVLKEYDSKEGIIILLMILFQVYFIHILDQKRKKSLIKRYNEGKLKMELEYECFLIHLLEIV